MISSHTKRGLLITWILCCILCTQCTSEYSRNLEVIVQQIESIDQELTALEQYANSEIQRLSSLIEALASGDGIISIETQPVSESETIYKFSFASGKVEEIRIHNGVSGESPGEPPFGIKRDWDGNWYWTMNGQWLLTSEGAKMPAITIEAYAITPLLKITDGDWYYSIDNGQTWVFYCTAHGADGNDGHDGVYYGVSFFDRILVGEDSVTFYMRDKDAITLPLYLDYYLSVATTSNIPIQAGSSITIPYQIVGSSEISIECGTTSGWRAQVNPDTPTEGTLTVRAPSPYKDGTVTIITSSPDGKMRFKTLSFIEDPGTPIRIAYSRDPSKIDGCSEVVLLSDGTIILERSYDEEDGILLLLCSLQDDTGFMAFLDSLGTIKGLFVNDILFRFGNFEENGVDMAFSTAEGLMETTRLEWDAHNTSKRIITKASSVDDHSGFVNTSNLILHLDGIRGAVTTLASAKSASAATAAAVSTILHHFDALDTGLSLAGADDITEMLGVDPYLEWGESLIDFGFMVAELAANFGKTALNAGTLWGAVTSWCGAYTKYVEQSDKIHQAYFRDCMVEVSNIEVDGTNARITTTFSGLESWENALETGIAVGDWMNPKFNESCQIQPADHNGAYYFNQTGLKMGVTYHCRPFIVHKSRDGLWKWGGAPLVRYGKDCSFSIPTPMAITGKVKKAEALTATVECKFEDVPTMADCGILVDGVRTIPVSKDATEAAIPDLDPATEYTYRAFVQVNGERFYGATRTLVTGLPDILGTWNCVETHYSNTGEVMYESYSVTLYEDGSVYYSGGEFESGGWWQHKYGLEVAIAIYSAPAGTYGTDYGLQLKVDWDDFRHPSRGIGTACHWRYFNPHATESNNYYYLEMTR